MARNDIIDMRDSEESVSFGLRLLERERAAWVEHCASHYPGLSAQDTVRLLMRNEMGVSLDGSGRESEVSENKVMAIESPRSKTNIPIKGHFTESEAAKIKELAKENGISISLWLARASRACIRFDSEPNTKELNNLIESNYNLKAIGRNLNQIARRMNEGQKAELNDLKSIKASVNHHTKVVSKLIKSCVNRWDLK